MQAPHLRGLHLEEVAQELLPGSELSTVQIGGRRRRGGKRQALYVEWVDAMQECEDLAFAGTMLLAFSSGVLEPMYVLLGDADIVKGAYSPIGGSVRRPSCKLHLLLLLNYF